MTKDVEISSLGPRLTQNILVILLQRKTRKEFFPVILCKNFQEINHTNINLLLKMIATKIYM